MYDWFFNNAPTRGSTGTSALLAKLTARTRTMHSHQAYNHLLNKTLMPIIAEKYQDHCDTTPVEKRKSSFKFRNDTLKEMYAEESDAVKALVEKFRNGDLGLDDEAFDALENDDDAEYVEELREVLQKDEAKKSRDREK